METAILQVSLELEIGKGLAERVKIRCICGAFERLQVLSSEEEGGEGAGWFLKR